MVRAFYRSSMIKPHHYIEFKKNQTIKFLGGKLAPHFNLLRTRPRLGQKVLYNQGITSTILSNVIKLAQHFITTLPRTVERIPFRYFTLKRHV